MSSVVSASSMRNTPTQFAYSGSEGTASAGGGGGGGGSSASVHAITKEMGVPSDSSPQESALAGAGADDTIVTTRVASGDAVDSSPAASVPQDNGSVRSNDTSNNNRNTSNNNNNTTTNDTDNNGEPEFEYKFDAMNIVTLPTDKLIQMLTALLEKIVNSNDRLNSGSPADLLEESVSEKHAGGASDEDTSQRELVSSILSFKGKHVPQIGLEQYFHRIQKYCPTTNDVFLSLLIYFDRISKKCNSKLQEAAERVAKAKAQSVETEDKELLREGEKCAEGADGADGTDQPYQTFVMDSYNIHRLIIAGITVSTKFFSDFFYSNSRYARVGGISLKEMNHLELQFLVLSDFELIISVEEMERYANLLYRFWHSDAEASALNDPPSEQ